MTSLAFYVAFLGSVCIIFGVFVLSRSSLASSSLPIALAMPENMANEIAELTNMVGLVQSRMITRYTSPDRPHDRRRGRGPF